MGPTVHRAFTKGKGAPRKLRMYCHRAPLRKGAKPGAEGPLTYRRRAPICIVARPSLLTTAGTFSYPDTA